MTVDPTIKDSMEVSAAWILPHYLFLTLRSVSELLACGDPQVL